MKLGVGWVNGSLSWISRTLSTAKPITSPHLSVIQLELSCPVIDTRSINALAKAVGDDFRWIADEIARIEDEFGGAVNSTVLWDPPFRMVSRELNVRFILLASGQRLAALLIRFHSSQILQRSDS